MSKVIYKRVIYMIIFFFLILPLHGLASNVDPVEILKTMEGIMKNAQKSIPQPPASVQRVHPKTVIVVVQQADVREGNSEYSEIITTLRKGDAVTMIGIANNWAQVELDDGRKGWIYKTMIGEKGEGGYNPERGEKQRPSSFPSVTIPTPVERVKPVRVIVTAPKAHVRINYTFKSLIIATLRQGDIVTKLAQHENWIQVELDDGARGWVYNARVELKGPVQPYPPYGQSRTLHVKKVNPTPVIVISRLANVRESYSSNSRIITTLEKGVTVIKMAEAGNWVQVELDDGRKGWIYRTLIEAEPAKDSNVEGETEKSGNQKSDDVKKNDGWNKSKENEEGDKKTEKLVVIKSPWADNEVLVRKGPGTSYNVIGKLNSGDNVLYLGQEGDWAYIKAPGTKENEGYKGYVYKKFIK